MSEKRQKNREQLALPFAGGSEACLGEREGTYEPKPVTRMEIPKLDGGMGKLGIPTVLDRFVQQAVQQVLQKQWDPTFSDTAMVFDRGGRPSRQ